MNDVSLISLVRRYEELYNLQHSGYSNHLRRDNVWEEIGNQLSENGITCRERWQRIRENFRKALNLRKTKRGQGAENIKPPKFYKELSFLLPYLNDEEDRRTKSGGHVLTSPSSLIDSPDGDSQLSDSSLSYLPKYTPPPKRRYTQPLSIDQPSPAEFMAKQIYPIGKTESRSCYSLDSDPLIDFFLTMAKTVKTFPLNKQLEIKGQVFQLVHNVEIDLMNEQYSAPVVRSSEDRPFQMVSVATDNGEQQFKLEPPS